MRTIRLTLVTLLLAGAALAGDPIFSPGGLAIRGYDPVAYFESGRPTEGLEAWSHRWMGATWRFASREHRDAFAADPQSFAPQYGGYCAWAVSRGDTAPIDPTAWKIVDGKLYLNYSARIQRKWEKQLAGNIASADAAWPELRER